MRPDQTMKAQAFRALHGRQGTFVIPNPWAAGTARILAALGFEALATTSAGLAFSLGRRDAEGAIDREETLANARAIVCATDLPVSADLEDGFGPRPEDCAETIRRAADIGLVGGSIEDTTTDTTHPIHDFSLAVKRVAAAAARALSFPFTLTARAENFLFSRPDLDETVARLTAFETAGADVLYAPGLPDLSAIRTICAAVSRPVNVVVGLIGPRFTVAELAEAGVKRISLGGTLCRAALGGFLRAAREIKERGTFGFADDAMPFSEAKDFMRPTTEKRPGGGDDCKRSG
jgi:2-methylisocitrate lyase-like PEP mutase family enzyme